MYVSTANEHKKGRKKVVTMHHMCEAAGKVPPYHIHEPVCTVGKAIEWPVSNAVLGSEVALPNCFDCFKRHITIDA